jgi:tetratricopeptide (TPR) repeat protein
MAIESLGGDVRAVADAIAALEYDLGLQLDAQTRLMASQLGQLEQIAEALRTPAKTRAAERLGDVGELLRRGRWERALDGANLAIDDDPNNGAAFLAAAWADLGLDDVEGAKKMFLEAADASDGDERSSALRQAARVTLALAGPDPPLDILSDAERSSSPDELAAIEYDRAIYNCEAGRFEQAAANLTRAGDRTGTYLLRAMVDPLLTDNDALMQTAESQLEALRERINELTAQVEGKLRELATAEADLRSNFSQSHPTFVARAEDLLRPVSSSIAEGQLEVTQAPKALAPHRLSRTLASLERVGSDLRGGRSALEGERLAYESQLLEGAQVDLCKRERASVVQRGDRWFLLERGNVLASRYWLVCLNEAGQLAVTESRKPIPPPAT